MQFQKKKAIYLQIAEFVCEKILLKEWHGKIPSVRELAIMLEVNPNTIIRAYTNLEEKAIIRIERGIGFFVTDNAIESILTIKRKQFLQEELPQVFKQLDFLDISFDELQQLYKENKANEEK